MKSKKNQIAELKVLIFSIFFKMSNLPFIKQIKQLFSLVFVEVAPGVPISLRNTFSGTTGKKAFFIGYVVTFFFTFIVNLVWSHFNNTLSGGGLDSDVIYFFQDYWNLTLYVLICPLYVGFTCWLAVVVIKGWSEIKEFKENQSQEEPPKPKYVIFKIIAVAIIILFVAFSLTTNYINDISRLTEANPPRYYWFLNGEDHQLGAFSVYYFLLNYSLLIITLLAIMFFMSIYSIMMKFGKTIALKESIDKLKFTNLMNKLSAFTEAYIIAKILVSLYILNILIWGYSPLGEYSMENVRIAVVAVGLLGIYMISVPRYFVEIQWKKLKNKSPDLTENQKYEDLREDYPYTKLGAQIIDSLFIGYLLFKAIGDFF